MPLRGNRRHRFGRVVHAAAVRKGLHLAGGALEEVLVGVRALLRLGAAHRLFLREPFAFGDLLADRVEVLQRFRLHSRPFSAIDRALPGATTT